MNAPLLVCAPVTVAPELKLQRPGIAPATLAAAGIEHIDGTTAQQRCGIPQPGLWIPYRNLDATPVEHDGKPYGRLRLDVPQGDKKYHQASDSPVHVYFPPGITARGKVLDLVIVEGEFKALALVEAGVPAIGISGFYGFGVASGEHFIVNPGLVEALQVLAPKRILFLGDADTALNWQFSDAAVKLAHATETLVALPRIPIDGPGKGVDDCRQSLRQGFPPWWDNIVGNAEPLNRDTSVDELAVRIVRREADAIAKLKGADREQALRRFIKFAANMGDVIVSQQLQELALQVFGTKARAFTTAVKAEGKSKAREGAKVVAYVEGQPAPDGRQRVLLSGPDREVSTFAGEVGCVMARSTHWFLRANTPCVVAADPVTGATVFENMDPARAVSSLEQVVQTGVLKHDGHGGDSWFQPLSMRLDAATVLLKSDQLRTALPRVDRILEVPLPVMATGRTVVLPTPRYNPELKIWLSPHAPTVNLIPLDDAAHWLEQVLQGFAFVGPQDRTHFIAHLLTHMAAGLLPDWSTRCPLYIYLGNRSRVGKDYLAGIVGLLFEGHAIEESPLTNDEAETTKRLVTAMRKGRRRLHFSNCAGALESPAFEAFLTNPFFTGRLLGVSDDITVPNETVVSISGRTGLTVSPDLALRSRIISQTWHEENINARTFPVPDLHDQVRKYRGEILSALHTFVMRWVQQGCPAGPTGFASFSEWARVVGGIMAVNNLGDPCLPQVDALLPMDRETDDMKSLFLIMHASRAGQSVTSADIMSAVKAAPDEDLFPSFDLTKPGDRARFGQTLRRFDKRVLGGIRLEIIPQPSHSAGPLREPARL